MGTHSFLIDTRMRVVKKLKNNEKYKHWRLGLPNAEVVAPNPKFTLIFCVGSLQLFCILFANNVLMPTSDQENADEMTIAELL